MCVRSEEEGEGGGRGLWLGLGREKELASRGIPLRGNIYIECPIVRDTDTRTTSIVMQL